MSRSRRQPRPASQRAAPAAAKAARSRRRLTAALVVVVAAALAAHLWFWYAPRPRPAALDGDQLPARVVAASDGGLRLWLAHPHQNLGALGRRHPRLAGLWRGSLPPFAVFEAPPAHELALARDDRGGLAVARVYPAAALLAKAAGKLANNPWLGGGGVTIDGREGQVEWQGRLWVARWGEARLPGDGGLESAALLDDLQGRRTLLVGLDREVLGFELPAPGSREPWTGLWAGSVEDGGLVLERVERAAARSAEQTTADRTTMGRTTMARTTMDRMATVLDPLAGDPPDRLGLVAMRDRGSSAETLFVVDHRQDPRILRLPSAALAVRGALAERVLELPAGELFDALGARFREETVDGWSVLATDLESAELARARLPRLPVAAGAAEPETWALAFRPAAVHRLAKAIDDAFRALPVGGTETRARWRRYREGSEALLDVPWVSIVAREDTLVLRLAPPAPE